ncbi:MAG: metal-dependent transcriptional regulator [Clostridia bacterium]|nr:metal-dependent transcriptional regulator [Clostridia bacterium]MDE7328621.1 metal-dependent transcriptional regulator [Clostridia bacterium]
MYLETILLLKKKCASVHSIRIAEELGYSRPSVSRGVNLLAKKGYITISQTGEINFTNEGRKKAEGIYERHEVITKLLESVGADKNLAEENACRIEHVITPELFEILKNFIENKS